VYAQHHQACQRANLVKRVIKLKLTLKLTLVLVSFAAALLLGISLIGYSQGQSSLKAATVNEMETIAGEKEAAVTAWVQEKQTNIAVLSNAPWTIDAVSALAAAPLDSPDREMIHDRLVGDFKPWILSGEFRDLFLLDPHRGTVILAVQPNREGKSKSDRAYFLQGKQKPYTTPIYLSPELRAPTMLVSAPVFGEGGEFLAVLVGRLNLEELSAIVQRRSGLRETDDAFLVNGARLVVTQPRFLPDPGVLRQEINTVPVNLCVQQKRGTVFANDYRNVPVIASYRWMSEHKLCLIVKISQAEAFASIEHLRGSILGIVLATLGVATALAHALSRTIVRPLTSMQAAVQSYGRGNREVRLPEMRRDELGVLAHEFNQMAALLAEKELDLEEHARTLEQKVQERTLQLADAHEFMQRILSSAPIGIFTYRLSGECLSANAAGAEMVGATVVQLEHQNFHELESWKRSGLYDLAEQAIACKELTAADVHILTTFGRDAWYRAKFVTFKSKGEEILLMIFEDITGRQQARAALEASEKRFRTWIENSSDIISVLDASGIIQYDSPSAKRLLDYSPEELLGKKAFDFVHPEDKDRIITSFVESIQNPNSTISDEFRFRHRDGSWRFLEAISRSYVDEYGEVVSLIHSRDITDRKLGEKALKEKERLLSEAQRIGHVGSWSYEIWSDALTFSDEMYHLMDILPEEFQHNKSEFLALVYPSDRPAAARWMENMKEGTQSSDLNFRLFHKNGELCYLYSTGAIEYEPNGKPMRFIGMTQDVTERRVAEIQINQQIERLTALSEIDRAIISSFDQHHTLDVILSSTISQLQVDAAAVLILDSEGQALDYAAGQGFRTNGMEGARVPLGEIHAGRAAKERRVIRILDLRECTNTVPFSRFVTAEGFVSYLGVPLIVKGKVKGVLEVYQRSPLHPYQDWLDFFHALAGQTAIAIENTSLLMNLQSSNQELTQAYEATIEGWSRAMDLRDRETSGHSQRVTNLTLELARALGLDPSRLAHLRRGALLHDLGKFGVPDHILFKTGELTVEERVIMEKHPEYAYEMLAPIPYLKPALSIPYFHHERWDGTGYPLGLKGEQIPLEARVFAVVDVWDALLSDRPHRKAWAREDVIEYIRRQAGVYFDPQVVECFLEMIKKSF